MCTPADDDVFGPVVGPGCRGGFDFTLLFEHTILTLLPAAAFFLAGVARLAHLARTGSKTRHNPFRPAKAVVWVLLLTWQLSVLFSFELEPGHARTRASVAAAAANVVVAVQFLLLSWLEDERSIGPSDLLCTYLALTAVLDLPQARTLWLLHYPGGRLAPSFSAGVLVKVLLLVLESMQKRAYLMPQYAGLPPESTSGIINQGFLWWLNGLIRRGLHPPPLSVHELYDLDLGLSSSALARQLQLEWDKRKKPERRLELVWTVCRALWWPMLQAVFPRLLVIALRFLQPFLLSSTLALLVLPDDENTDVKIYCLVAATALVYVGHAVAMQHFSHVLYRAMTMSRGALVGLIYNRALLIQDGVYDESAAVTLMSSDTDRIVSSLNLLHGIWARTIELVIGVFLLERQVGWLCVMPLIWVFVASFGSTRIARQIGGHSKVWIGAVQKRVGVTSTALEAMRSVKMLGLVGFMTDLLQKLRVRETKFMEKLRWDIVWQNIIGNFPPSMTPPTVFSLYALQAVLRGDLSSIDVNRAFTSLAIMQLVAAPAASLLAEIPLAMSGIGSFDRIQKFLLEPLRQDGRNSVPPRLLPTSLAQGSSAPETPTSPAQNGTGTGTGNGSEAATSDAAAICVSNLDVRPAPSADIVLQDVSFQLPERSLTVVLGPVASGKSTLLKAILGEVPYEKGSVSIGDNRIAYCAQTPWLPSATVRQAICGPGADFDGEWYSSCLRACALDRDLTTWPDGDETEMGSGGAMLSGGQKHRVALARALYTRASIVILDDMLSALDNTTRKSVIESLFGEAGLFRKLGSTVVLVAHATECLPYADKILVLSKGKLEYDGTYNEATITGVIDRVLPTLQRQDEEESKSDAAPAKKKPQEKGIEIKNLTRQTGDSAVYKYYFRAIGWKKASVFLFGVTLLMITDSFPKLWLKWWSDAKGEQPGFYLGVYLTLPFLYCLAVGIFAWSFLIAIAPSSSNKLHYALLKTVMRAPQSYFTSTPTGEILNMFSQDMTLIEGTLAIGAGVSVMHAAQIIGHLGLIITASPYLTLTVPFLFLALYFLQHVYLRTSRQMRYLDLEARSPLYSHCLETLNGLVTIRAFGWQQDSQLKNYKLLDLSQRPYYLLYCCQQWLLLVLSLMVSAQTLLVVGLALTLRKTTDPGFLGVSLFTLMGFNSLLAQFIRGWTDLELSLGSVARIKNLEADVKPEDEEQETEEPPSWPDQGKIEFLDVTASHNPSAVALRGVTLTITPGQKLGLCGRTGSGKSSLVGTLLRLLDIDSGSILIDGHDLTTITRDTIRSRLVTLPQDPFILAGTVRLNADPLGIANDDAVIRALNRVGLWEGVLEDREGGLDAEITPSSLSKGQQQLLALARALISIREGKRRILLLDEPTSNVDPELDDKVQRVLREDCAECTVVTVAHRMNTILGSDVVAVMEEGRIVEVGNPQDLLSSQDGKFAKLVNG